MSWVHLLFSFRGRISRGKYWLAVLISLIFIILWLLIPMLAATAFITPITFLIPLVGVIPLIISSVAVGIKRLHDRDKNGSWLMLFYFFPAVLDGIGQSMGDSGLNLSIVSAGISIWAFVEIGCLRGTIGPNRYGDDPLQPYMGVFD
jgi:uncharacterized membrane protein YhaH (DUF805 family)